MVGSQRAHLPNANSAMGAVNRQGGGRGGRGSGVCRTRSEQAGKAGREAEMMRLAGPTMGAGATHTHKGGQWRQAMQLALWRTTVHRPQGPAGSPRCRPGRQSARGLLQSAAPLLGHNANASCRVWCPRTPWLGAGNRTVQPAFSYDCAVPRAHPPFISSPRLSLCTY